ncbi:MAG: TetR/AcrR family transcriptional regulator [Euzebya sp.]
MSIEMKDLSVKAVRTRDGLLDAAEQLLRDGGELVSGAVARQADVSTGTFYRYFTDKDDLLAAAFARHLDALIATVEAGLDPVRIMDEGLGTAVDRVVVEVAKGYRDSSPVIAAAVARMTSSAAIRAVYRTRHEVAVEVFATFLHRAGRVGLLKVGDVRATAVSAVVLIQGLNHPALRQDGDGAVLAGMCRATRALLLDAGT